MTYPCRSSPAWLVLPILLVSVALTMGAALLVGSADLSPGQTVSVLWQAIRGQPTNDTVAQIVLGIRLPRIVLTVTIGAGMGLAGLASQTLFRNPLASPYVLGVSNGAAVGAVLAMLLVGKPLCYGGVPAMSVFGGLVVSAIVFTMARQSSHFSHSLLLAGIAISAFCSALTAAALYLAGERLQTLVFWLMGGLWQATWRDVLLAAPVIVAALIGLIILAPAMNVALVGERSASDLGVNVQRLQILLLIAVSVTTSVAVAVSGVIGFVGLIVPHLLRMIVGADHRGLVPASAAGGALLLLVADTLARTVAAPAEVPVGIVTALVGAPVFLWLLRRRTGYGGWA
ncbi:MAG: FecCD family ABC transporter permease [Thermoguttaceae bacterium]